MSRKFILYSILLVSLHSHSLQAQDFYDFGIREVRLEFLDDNWEKKLKKLKDAKTDSRVLANATIDGIRYDSVGVRYKGNSSYNNPRKSERKKLPLNIKLDYTKKKQCLPGGYTTLKLSNGFRDPSFIREPLAYEIARKYTLAPKCNFAKVYVGDKMLGLYVNTESVDQVFLKNNKSIISGKHVIKCDPEEAKDQPNAALAYMGEDLRKYYDIYELSAADPDWKRLIALTKTLTQNQAQAATVLDVDAAIWMLAFDNTIVNLDSYIGPWSHNYYLIQDTTGLYIPVIWDLNMSFGSFRQGKSSLLSDKELAQFDPLVYKGDAGRPLTQLLNNPFYAKLYAHHVRAILQDYILNGEYLKRASAWMDLIEPTFTADTAKLYGIEDFRQNLETTVTVGKSQIIGIKQLMSERGTFLQNHPSIAGSEPVFSEPSKSVEGDSVRITIKLSEPARVFLYAGNPYHYKRIEMKDDGLGADSVPSDQIYALKIPLAGIGRYYFLAETKTAIATFPVRAGLEAFQAVP